MQRRRPTLYGILNSPLVIHILSLNCVMKGTGDKCKKDIYARLCFDGGNKEVWVDKRSRGVCLAISSEAMVITGIDDRSYWNHISTDKSRFQTVAYLHQIRWLQVDGEIDVKPAQFKLKRQDGQHASPPIHVGGNSGNWAHYHVRDFVVKDSNAVTRSSFL